MVVAAAPFLMIMFMFMGMVVMMFVGVLVRMRMLMMFMSVFVVVPAGAGGLVDMLMMMFMGMLMVFMAMRVIMAAGTGLFSAAQKALPLEYFTPLLADGAQGMGDSAGANGHGGAGHGCSPKIRGNGRFAPFFSSMNKL